MAPRPEKVKRVGRVNGRILNMAEIPTDNFQLKLQYLLQFHPYEWEWSVPRMEQKNAVCLTDL